MKLIRARIQNFRLLRDLDLDFATGPKKLTVIRAANETGKTTIMTALQWALYGDDALPGKASEFRLHPINWNIEVEGRRVDIAVQVAFEVVKYHRQMESRRVYTITRTATEEIVGSEFRRSAASVRLLQRTDTGSNPIDNPESIINDELPKELRDVFFTDGDRALRFIEADIAVSAKRDKVQGAIRSLMGLGVIEDAIKHVKKAEAEANKQARQFGAGTDLGVVSARVDQLNDEIAEQDQKIEVARESFDAFEDKLKDVEDKIDEVLKKGDQEKLQQERERTKRDDQRLAEQEAAALKEHSNLFRSEELAYDLLKPKVEAASSKLDALHKQNKIPNTTIPILEQRLINGTCICGETLAEDGADGSRRRQHISHLIEESRQADALQSTLTALFYDLRAVTSRQGNEGRWVGRYEQVAGRRQDLAQRRADLGRKAKSLELQLDALKGTDVQTLRHTKRQYKDQIDRFRTDQTIAETRRDGLRRELVEKIAERDRLLKARDKGDRIVCNLRVIDDILSVLDGAFQRITNEELANVSALMNDIFLEMIGADPQQGAVIKRAEINQEFDILVVGPESRRLDPDRDLNGASRRALTLAFILALTKVSEVEAPNVIDTPLGMMSGFVKTSVLRTAIEHSSQLVLFLTHSEIDGCEDIIDEFAGRVMTLTNTAHYPKMLVNKPPIEGETVLRCECDHRSHCAVCERVAGDEIGVASRSAFALAS